MNALKKLITETVRKHLLEYVQPSFNFKDFTKAMHEGYSALFQYCTRTLGQKVGQGTARVVFDYEDDTVLKIAANDSGRSQNQQEYEVFKTVGNNPLIPRIYDADTDTFIWLLSETVLPCKEVDFEKILGIPYASSARDKLWRTEDEKWDYSDYKDAEQPFDKPNDEDDGEISYLGFLAWYSDYIHDYLDYTDDWSEYETEQYTKLMQTDWFRYLLELFEFQDHDEFGLENFGIAMRNGKPMIVVLDIGWNSKKM